MNDKPEEGRGFTPISFRDAFNLAPPRSPAVLCYDSPEGGTRVILTEWFSWLNFVRNPMISFSMPRSAQTTNDLKGGASLYLCIPPVSEALKFKEGLLVPKGELEGKGEEYRTWPALAEREERAFPAKSEVILSCTLAGAYNYPFKKVRIFNCNLEECFQYQA